MRLLIGITNCHKAVYPDVLSRKEPPNNALCVDSARETWIKDAMQRCVDVKFFFGRGAMREPLWDEVFLDVDDSYNGLIEKVTAMANWAWEHGYDYFMKVDVDSFVHIDNLLKESEFWKWDYVGRGWGLGYLLSRKGMKIVTDARQKMSWAEDSHVLRTIFKYAGKPGNTASLYADGRFVFLPNLMLEDVPLYDTAFIAVNPMTPESMLILNETKALSSIQPFSFSREDLWTGGEDRVEHCSIYNAFCLLGAPCPWTFDQWSKLSAYARQPAKDFMTLIFALMEMDELASAPTFAQWMGPIEDRKALLSAARKVNTEAAEKLARASMQWKKDQLLLDKPK